MNMKIFVLIIALCAVSCSKTKSSNPIEGTWQSTTATCEAPAVDKSLLGENQLEFKDKKSTLTLKKTGCTSKIEYDATVSPSDFILSHAKVVDDKCGVAKSASANISQIFAFELNSGVMKVRSQTGSDGCRVFVKK